MKVPKMYKSSDRYNAGVDVIYDDDSKLQYAPFIYAGVTAKDNGDDSGGDDDEGEDIMIIEKDNTQLNKNFNDIRSAMTSGKSCVILTVIGDNVYHEYVTACYDYGEDYADVYGAEHRYYVESITAEGEVMVVQYYADTTTDNLVVTEGGME